jgi:hypothetical protein
MSPIPWELLLTQNTRPDDTVDMWQSVTEPAPPTDLSARLTRRMSIEAGHHKGKRAHGRGDFFLWHDDVVRPVLKWSLKSLGLYQAGLF